MFCSEYYSSNNVHDFLGEDRIRRLSAVACLQV